MKRTGLISSGLLLAIVLFFTSSVHAHKVRIFAYNEGDEIITESVFSGGRTVKNSEIIVQDADSGSVILTGRTDDQGLFRFPIPEAVKTGKPDLKIIINCGEGHKGEWLLSAEEYLGEQEAEPEPLHSMEQTAAKESVETVSRLVSETQVVTTIDEQLISRVVEQALDKKLTPIKRMLAENREHKPTLTDILGGIGYLVGLAGIAAYLKSRKDNSQLK